MGAFNKYTPFFFISLSYKLSYMEYSFAYGDIFNVVFNIVYFITILFTIVIIVLDNRSPVKTLAWILVLFFLPLIGLFFYYFVGRNTRKNRLISKKGFTRIIKRPMAEYQAQKAFYGNIEGNKLMSFFKNINSALPFEGNSLETYSDGYSMVSSLIKEIYKAKHHIHMEFYIFNDDALGKLIRDCLIDKAKEGVEIRVLYDDVGCWRVSDSFYEKMRGNGIEAKAFLKVRYPLFTSKINYRNHRKIVVIDGKVGFIGGMNIANRYIKGVKWGIWKDLHSKIEGKAVYGLQTAFLTDWYAVDRSLITSSKYFPEMEEKGSSLIQIVTSDPVGEWHDIMQGYLIAIENAKRYLYIQTPYLLPTDSILLALQNAALAGVDVRIMIPKRGDTFLTHIGTLSYLSMLMESGVKIYMYKKGFLHSKLIVIDDIVSTVGSTNMDFRSFEHNFEVNAIMYDRDSAIHLKNIFLNDMKGSMILSKKAWEKRSLKERMAESAVRIMAPLL